MLKYKSPMEILLGKPVNLYHLHVFERTCFVHSPLGNKFDLHARKCVFLGYSFIKKGYKCFDPTFKKLFISKDVTIYETHIFFFRDQIQRDMGTANYDYNGLDIEFAPVPMVPTTDDLVINQDQTNEEYEGSEHALAPTVSTILMEPAPTVPKKFRFVGQLEFLSHQLGITTSQHIFHPLFIPYKQQSAMKIFHLNSMLFDCY